MWIDLNLMPDEFIEEHQLNAIERNGKALAEVMKGMHGLKEAGKLAHDELKEFLKPHCCEPTKHPQECGSTNHRA